MKTGCFISKSRKVKNFLKIHEVHISLTTSPLRLPKISAVLETLDTTYVKNINIVLPEKYGKKKESYKQVILIKYLNIQKSEL